MFSLHFEYFNPTTWNGFDINTLDVDHAYLNITSKNTVPMKLYSLSADCKNCPFVFTANIEASSSKIITVDTAFDTVWRVYSTTNNEFTKPVADNRSLVCEISPTNFGQFGVYDLISDGEECQYLVQKYPVNIYLSFALIVIFGAIFFYMLARIFHHFELGNHKTDENMDVDDGENRKKKPSSRIKAVDVFRGIALCLMILVNDGGGGYWFLIHSPWDGITLADVVFPWFIWIMGVCVAISHKSQIKRQIEQTKIMKDILKRSFILFVLGIILNTLGVGPVELSAIRIPGVLQRFAISYLTVASIMTLFSFKYYTIKWLTLINDVMILWPQWFIYISFIIVHHMLTFYLPVPGCPTGYIGAGGIQDDGLYRNCSGGTTNFLDKMILGENHLYKGTQLFGVYHFNTYFDPENILGCLTSIFQVFLGVQAGCTLLHRNNIKEKIIHWIVWGLLCLVIGFYLHFTLIPLNKNLWSLSFVFVTSGFAFLLLALCYWTVDCKKCWNGFPFIYPGMNSIIVYVGHELCYNLFPWHWRLHVMNTHIILLLENIWGLSLWILISFWLYKKRFFLTI